MMGIAGFENVRCRRRRAQGKNEKNRGDTMAAGQCSKVNGLAGLRKRGVTDESKE